MVMHLDGKDEQLDSKLSLIKFVFRTQIGQFNHISVSQKGLIIYPLWRKMIFSQPEGKDKSIAQSMTCD